MPSKTAVRAFSAQPLFLAERSAWLRTAQYEQRATQFNPAKFDAEAGPYWPSMPA